jgi:GNAT superfamily N-acetyltransferase
MSGRIDIRRALPEDEGALREIAHAAKGHWGYDEALVAEFVSQLAVAGDERREVHVACVDGAPIGWMGVVMLSPAVCLLDDMWVAPAWMGRRVGSRLFRLAVERARARGAEVMELEAERHAVGFYRAMGALHLRDGEPSEWGPPNPMMVVDLRSGENG